MNDHALDLSNRIKNIADAIFEQEKKAPRKPYSTFHTFALIRTRRACQATLRKLRHEGDSPSTRDAIARLAYKAHEHNMLLLTAQPALSNLSAFYLLINTAADVVNLQAPLEEMALAAVSYLSDTSDQLTKAIEKDRSSFLKKKKRRRRQSISPQQRLQMTMAIRQEAIALWRSTRQNRCRPCLHPRRRWTTDPRQHQTSRSGTGLLRDG